MIPCKLAATGLGARSRTSRIEDMVFSVALIEQLPVALRILIRIAIVHLFSGSSVIKVTYGKAAVLDFSVS